MLGRRLAVVALAISLHSTSADAQAQQRPRRDTVYVLPELEIVASVTGQGKTRGASALDSALITRVAPAGTSALRAIERLPGVNMQSSDAYGVYEWSTRVTMRGFQTTQIGQTLDGVPLGDMTYGNFNGLNIARAIDPNNLSVTTVEQGSGALGTASANNLGGVVRYRSSDPSLSSSLRLQQLVGNYSSLRTHIRGDLGTMDIGANASLRGFVSYARTENDKWKGGGDRYSSFPGNNAFFFGQGGLFSERENWQDQLNLKADLLLGTSRFTAFYNYSDKKESDYMDLSLSVYNDARFGPFQDYWTSWADAKRYAELAARGDPLGDVAYFASAQGARQDHFGYMRGDFSLGQVARLLITPYFHTNRGGGDWHAPSYGAAFSPDPIMFRQTQYHLDRFGATGVFAANLGNHQLEGGIWLESNEVNLRRPRWGLVNYAAGPEVNYRNVLRLDFDRSGEMKTVLLYAQNTNRFLEDRLRLTYGLKYLHVDAQFRSNGNTPTDGVVAPSAPDAARPSLDLPTSGLLPQLGAVYAITPTEEIFGNYSENVNQYPYSPQSGVYNASPTLFQFLEDETDNERASTFDVGIRTRRERLEGSLALYFIDYRNRLLGVSLCPPTVTCATGLGNVGSVNTRGAEALVSYQLVPGLVWFNTAAYNSSTFAEDYLQNPNDPTTVVATEGKDVQDAPRILLTSSLELTRGQWNANVTGRHVAKRFFTYTNDLTTPGDGDGFVPSYNLVDAAVGYRFERLSALKGVTLQLNIKNLFDERYISTIGTNGFGTRGDNQTLLTGPRRLLFVTLGFGL